jgi:Zn-dependent protease with chaperone function
MTNERFNSLVARLEEQARSNPAAYKFRVFLLALLGYGYLGVMIGLILALFLLALGSLAYLKGLALKLIIPVGVFLWVVLRAMWVRLAPPEGRRVLREEAPLLFALIDKLRRNLRAPRFHRVLITDEFNAAVVQVPRLGLFGWHRNYLLIGLPLMKLMTPLQFEAVLAHEFGHLAGGHGWMSNWIYRLRMSWARLVPALEQQKSWGTFLFRRFFYWYSPYFAAYSFPLARSNEYDADATSARAVSLQATAEALTSVNVIGSYLEEQFWSNIHLQVYEQPRPACAPYARMGERLGEELDPEATTTWLDQAMALKTTAQNTHPSLTDRLQAIGQPPRLSPPLSGQAADRLLGQSLAKITAEFDNRWHQSILPSWEKRYQEVQEGRARLTELDKRAATQELSIDDAYQRARLTESYGRGAGAALEQYRTLYLRAPDDYVICFVLGQRLLWRDDDSGLKLIERAMELNGDAIVPGCAALRDHYWRTGREQKAHTWNDRMVERENLIDAANAERDNLNIEDEFEPHGLPAETLADLQQQLRTIGGLKKAFLVRKRVKHFSDSPLYVLGHTTCRWWSLHSKRKAQEVQQQIIDNVIFPGQALVLNVEGANQRFARKLRFMRGSQIL